MRQRSRGKRSFSNTVGQGASRKSFDLLSCDLLLRVCLFLILVVGPVAAQDSATEVDKTFQTEIVPFLQQYCASCHSGSEPEAKLDVEIFKDLSAVATNWQSWQAMVSRVHEQEMPPKDASPLPDTASRQALENWTNRYRRSEAERYRGDPGVVTTRRLSNAEFNNTIRDITGIDIQPAKDFPVDPANEAGFDNSGESLTMSPALIAKYMDAVRRIADHLLLTPSGIRFAPHPVVTDTDRDKYCVQRIVDFYERQPTNLGHYFLAAWQKRRSPQMELETIASRNGVSSKYLQTIWDLLEGIDQQAGPVAELRALWKELLNQGFSVEPSPELINRMTDFCRERRAQLAHRFTNLKGPGMNGGSQPLVLWKNRQMAANRRSCNPKAIDPDSAECALTDDEKQILRSRDTRAADDLKKSYEWFCSVIPDAFFVKERGRAHIDEKESNREGKGRLLSAGFHSMMGYFRDDQPLCELVLNDVQREELDQLWNELDFISMVPIRQYSGFIWFERAESSFINEEKFHFVRAEDRSANTSEMIQKFGSLYLEKLQQRSAVPEVIDAVEYHFREMDQKLRRLENQRRIAEPLHLQSLLEFASKAFRRPLRNSERLAIESFYHKSLLIPNASHHSAIEDTLVSVLISPAHLYRWDLQSRTDQLEQLDDFALASRLSYFLWSSCPDNELLSLAARGKLRDPETLVAQMHRLLGDKRVGGMAREFVGNWLDFRRFESHNGVDRGEFPSFDDQLRQSMFLEPIEFFQFLLWKDGRLRDLIDADHLVVDSLLARHYGLDVPLREPNEWTQVSNQNSVYRGGLLSMAVFLTQNSPGLRTSPVKRGYWVVRKLLGERIPPPPPNVPELPASEHQLGEKTLRVLLAQHRDNPSCASCHNRFDSAGLLLEGFDPIGRSRTNDLAGRTVATDAILPNGYETQGLDGLKTYILKYRMEDFRRHFCESLASFGLGRTLILSDDLLVEEMLEQLRENEDRVTIPFEVLVRSSQFLSKRGKK